jgi:excinuclease ABC subunit C
MKKFKFLTKNRISQLPKTSGVYCFKKGQEILYIGKAANIRERVKNHFQQPTFKDRALLNLVKQLGYIKTDSEIEALILEANLIKKYQPKYNIIWKDDKNYFFVGITTEDYPRVFITHQTKFKKQNAKCKITIQNLKFIGPFVNGKSLKATLKVLRKVFPYRSCKTLPKRPCLWYHLNRCPAPCLLVRGRASNQLSLNFYLEIQKESQKNAKNLMKILQGKKKQVLNDLKKEMKKASSSEDFEEAAKIRDQIEALEKVLAHAKIFELVEIEPQPEKDWGNTQEVLQKILKIKKRISRIEAYDISNIQGKEATGSMVTFIQGLPDKKFYRKFRIKIQGKPNDIAMIKETLSRRFNHPEWSLPDLILIDGGIGQLSAALRIKNEKCKMKNYNLKFKIISLTKKENKLFIENRKKPILLKSLPREIFNLILRLRDEAHRFAISYHKKLRKKSLLGN